ncbi:hypothetical protein B0H66DRAFT_605562 [Apodospora peruviana]|uniref:Uncharacterized protein n=1 Tax=Apodospora peruviana TaxID=516989 RepID=A0AAE0HZ74_9PEZI|nr:hypothetical protein B0H66DRAFT_605562 [Apodospora peruviana]
MPPPNTPEEDTAAVIIPGVRPAVIVDEYTFEELSPLRSASIRRVSPWTSAPASVLASPPPASGESSGPASGPTSRSTSRSTSSGQHNSVPSHTVSQQDIAFPIDHQSLEYPDGVDETLQCPICRTPFYQPVTTKTCGHTFCSSCLDRALDLQRVCPIDRQPLSQTRDLYQTRVILDQLDRLKVKCPNKGCEHVCTRDRLSSHYTRYCDYTLVRCPEASCNRPVARMDARPDIGCLHKEAECQYCHMTVVFADLDAHYDRDCVGHTAECAYCSAVVVHHRMDKHISTDCPEVEVPCRSAGIGCEYRNKRYLVNRHEKHSCLVGTVAQLQRAHQEDRMLINDLRNRVIELEVRSRRTEQHHSSSSSDNRRLMGDILDDFDLGNSPRVTALPSSYLSSASGGSPEDYYLAQFERIESQLEDLRKLVREMDGHHTMRQLNDTMVLNEQITELTGKVNILNMHTTWLMNIQRRARAAGGSPSGAMSNGNNGSHGGATGNGATGVTGTRTIAGTGANTAIAQALASINLSNIPSRRNSDGRGENPPRL